MHKAWLVYLDLVQPSIGGVLGFKKYTGSINTVCLADTLAILGYAVDATHIKTALAKRVRIESETQNNGATVC
jgi:hypothetical protein